MSNIILKPTWAKHEKGVHSSNTKTQIRETDAFLDERDKETEMSTKARKWEEARKKEWASHKPLWRKQKTLAEQKDMLDAVRKLKEGGYLMENLKPAPGFLLIKPDSTNDRQTASGVYLPGSVAEETCTATVGRCGDSKQTLFGGKDDCPTKEGERVLYRHDTGLRVSIKWDKMLLISFSAVLGTLED